QQLVNAALGGDLHTAVVDLDRFAGLEVVPDHHPPLAADQRGPHFYGRQPAHGYVGDHAARKAEGDVGDVGQAAQVSAAGGHDALGLAADEVVDDGQVVGRQVPDHVDVVLEEAQVDPGGVVVVEGPQFPRVRQLLDLADGRVEQDRVVHHDLQPPAVGELDE